MKKIIGYFHICQIGEWKRSFDLIFNRIKNYGLYDNTTEIRLGILSDTGNIIDDYRLHDHKFKIIFVGRPELYERPTLLHMRNSCNDDGHDTIYWYMHTKGLRHFGTHRESFVIDWIKLMLYWNVQKWRYAVDILNTHETYGINLLGMVFYSGNFWWATGHHIAHLPTQIEDYYTAPEDWILRRKDGVFQAFSSGIQGEGHYNENFHESRYMQPDDLNKILPDNFYIDTYKIANYDFNKKSNDEYIEHYFSNNMKHINYDRAEILNNYGNKLKEYDFDFDFYKSIYNELNNFSDEELIEHWLTKGIFEKRFCNKKMCLPEDFDLVFYKSLYTDLNMLSNYDLIYHWINNGKDENRLYNKKMCLPEDFDLVFYKTYYDDVSLFSDNEIIMHWVNNGKQEDRLYNKIMLLPKNFDLVFYKTYYDDLFLFSDDELIMHWGNNGKSENRIYNKKMLLPENFDLVFYKTYYSDLSLFSDDEIIEHWLNNGKKENRKYNKQMFLPKDFNLSLYKKINTDLKDMSDVELIIHWNKHGSSEGRKYK